MNIDLSLATVTGLMIILLAVGTMWEIPVDAKGKCGRFQPLTIRVSIFAVLAVLSSAFIFLLCLKLS